MEDRTQLKKRVEISIEQKEEVLEALVGFVKRVADGKSTNQEEVAVLPDIARLLIDTRRAL